MIYSKLKFKNFFCFAVSTAALLWFTQWRLWCGRSHLCRPAHPGKQPSRILGSRRCWTSESLRLSSLHGSLLCALPRQSELDTISRRRFWPIASSLLAAQRCCLVRRLADPGRHSWRCCRSWNARRRGWRRWEYGEQCRGSTNKVHLVIDALLTDSRAATVSRAGRQA